MTTTPPVAPTPPASKPSLKAILTDIRLGLGSAAAVAEGVLLAFPSGPVHSAVAVAIPFITGLAALLLKLGD